MLSLLPKVERQVPLAAEAVGQPKGTVGRTPTGSPAAACCCHVARGPKGQVRETGDFP